MKEGKPSHLSVVDGERTTARSGRRLRLDEAEQVTCWKCVREIGVETSAVVAVTLAPRRKPDGRKVGGSKVWACAHCLSRGEITELIKT